MMPRFSTGSDPSVMIPARYDFTFAANGVVCGAAGGSVVVPDSHYFVRDVGISRALGATLSAPMADLVDVAVAVYVADRLARRRPRGVDRYEHHWQRQMCVRLPLREPQRWADPAQLGALTRALAFLTEDEWTFEFAARPSGLSARRPAEMEGYLFPVAVEPPVTAALFSGGLDSLAGLVADLVDRPVGSCVLFSGLTNRRIGSVQRALVDGVRVGLGRHVVTAAAPFGLRRRGRRQYEGEERTQRTRGFAFLVLGAVAALAAGAEELRVYENGVGAINLPYTDGQLGSQSTRAMHPLTIRMVADVVRLAVGRPFEIVLPFLFHTKAELCARLGAAGLGHLARTSVSCDGFPQRVAGRAQCGVCTSCLLRRQGLAEGELAAYDPGAELYRHDVLDRESPIPVDKRYALRAMMDQAHRIRQALGEHVSWDGLVRRFPSLLEVAPAATPSDSTIDHTQRAIADMYRRYCDEWDSFAARLGDDGAARAFFDGGNNAGA